MFASAAFEGSGQAFILYYYEPSSGGSACSAQALIQSGLFAYERPVWSEIKLVAASYHDNSTRQRFDRVPKITDERLQQAVGVDAP